MSKIEDTWVDVSFTVKASTLNGGSLMRNTRTGEEKIVTEEDVLDFGQLALDFDAPVPMETLHINAEDVMSLPDEVPEFLKAVKAVPVKKPRVKK
jgi:hypothetical protein